MSQWTGSPRVNNRWLEVRQERLGEVRYGRRLRPWQWRWHAKHQDHDRMAYGNLYNRHRRLTACLDRTDRRPWTWLSVAVL